MGLSWTVGGIVLPIAPIPQMKHAAKIQSSDYPSKLPILIVLGRTADVLVLEGWFRVQGQNMTYIETTYIAPFEAKVATLVTIAAPDARYDGTEWVLAKFDYKEEGGVVRAVRYRMELWKGYLTIVV